jgi:hypothetical protein
MIRITVGLFKNYRRCGIFQTIDIPDNLAEQINHYVKGEIFSSEPDVTLAAMSEFVRRNQIDLMERFVREDIEWARKEALDPK